MNAIGVFADDIQATAINMLVSYGVDVGSAVAVVASAWKSSDHADAERISSMQSFEFFTAVQKLAGVSEPPKG